MKTRTLLLPFLALTLAAAPSFAQSADCKSLEKARKDKGDLQTQIAEINVEGKTRKDKCNAESDGGKRQKCLDGLQGLREKINSFNKKLAIINDDVEKFSALCSEASADIKKTIELYEKTAREECLKGGNAQRCEDALLNLADLAYKSDSRENLRQREGYERAYDAWKENDKQGKEPSQPTPSYKKAIEAHLKYLTNIPTGGRRDIILYRTSFIYDILGRSTEAFPLLVELSTKFPTSRHIGPTNLRIGEYHFVNRKYDSAIAYYNKVDVNAAGNESILGLALYHKAEALYQLGRYDQAAEAFFDYVERVDKGQITRGDLRNEAILYMGSSFAEFPNSYKDADAFFRKKGGRSYEDTLYYELSIKLADRDIYEQAIPALETFLKKRGDFYKAPLAQIKLIEVWDKRKKIEEAQDAREELIQRFGRGAPWWNKTRNIDKAEMERIQARIRDVMLEVAVQQHFPGKERRDTAMVKKGIASYQRFIEAYEAEGNWPIYRAKIYLADAYSWIGRHEEAADLYIWASGQQVNDPKKFREPTSAERTLTQPADAGYNAVGELQMAAQSEVDRQGGDAAKAYAQPITKRYMMAVSSYIEKFPKAPDVDNLSYNLFLFQVNGQDWDNAIPSGQNLLRKWPNYKFANDARARLAYSFTQAGRFQEAEKEYRGVLAALPAGDTLVASMNTNLGEVIWRRAEAAEKAGKTDSAVYHFRRLAKELPRLATADSAAFRAAVALENAKRYREAASEYLGFQQAFPRSGLGVPALLAAADNFRSAHDTAGAVKILVETLHNQYPNDSAAFNGIAQAASIYDSAGRPLDKARTLELYYQRYPKNDRTPAFLYTAGLTYEKAKEYAQAVRVYTLVVQQYPKNQYAPEAAFSIPIIEEKSGNKQSMADAYERFAAQYPNDKSKVAKAYLRGGNWHYEQKNWKKAEELFTKLTTFYSQGDNSVQIDASMPAEAWYKIGMIRTQEALDLKVGAGIEGKPAQDQIKKVAEQIKTRQELIKKANETLDNSIKLLIEEWTIKSAYQQAQSEYDLLSDVLAIPAPSGNGLKAIQERILFRVGTGKSLVPVLASRAERQFETFLALTNKTGIQNDLTKEAGRKLLSTYYISGRGFEGIGDAITEEPCPSKAKEGSDQYNEECEFHKAQKEDNQIQFQKLAVEKGYVPGIEKAAEIGVVNPYLDSIRARIKFISPDNKSIAVEVVEKKIETPVVQNVDAILQRALLRIKEIAEGDDPPEEKVRVLKSITLEGQRQEQELSIEITDLNKRSRGK